MLKFYLLKILVLTYSLIIAFDSIDSIANVIWLPIFMFLILYGQKIQMFMILRNVGKKLRRLEHMNVSSKNIVLKSLIEKSDNEKVVKERFDRLLSSFVIPPVSIDPKGIITKLEHILNTQEDNMKDEIKLMTKDQDDIEISVLMNLVEVSLGINLMHKFIRHFYISAKKTGNMMIIAQIQMILPQVMEQAEAYNAAIPSLKSKKPIGDGIGPLVASKLSGESKSKEVVRDTILNEVKIENRNAFIIRAKGPGGNVGKPGEVIKRVVEENKQISLIITIDAALKLEGEDTGEVAEGIGAAIGGPGIERYKIEEIATNNKIKFLAIVTKMSEKEAITEMKSEIKKTEEILLNKVKETIRQHSEDNQNIIIAGIGNTLGIK